MRDLLSGIVMGVCAVTLWAVLTKPKRRTWTRTQLRHNYVQTLDPAPDMTMNISSLPLDITGTVDG